MRFLLFLIYVSAAALRRVTQGWVSQGVGGGCGPVHSERMIQSEVAGLLHFSQLEEGPIGRGSKGGLKRLMVVSRLDVADLFSSSAR